MWNFDLSDVLFSLSRIVVSYLLAVPIGWNRERDARSAGLRTFPLVAVGACSYVLVARSFLGPDDALSRVIYGVITGIGFIGGGAILKQKSSVTGTATAASIWNTGAIGTAVALERLDMAIVLSALNVITLHFVARFKSSAVKSND